jgi:hypothetical protein
VQRLGHRQRVRHHRQPGHVPQQQRQRPGRGAGGQPDGLAGTHQVGGRGGDGLLLGLLAQRLGLEARFVGAPARRHGGPAVHLVDQPAPGQRVEVAPDGHVGDAELRHQVGDLRGAVLADPLQDPAPPLLGEQGHGLQGGPARRT